LRGFLWDHGILKLIPAIPLAVATWIALQWLYFSMRAWIMFYSM